MPKHEVFFPELVLPADLLKGIVFNITEFHLDRMGIRIVGQNRAKEWGGYFELERNSAAEALLPVYFYKWPKLRDKVEQLDFKCIIAAPGEEASGQDHSRRAEYWAGAFGDPVTVVTDEAIRPLKGKLLRPGRSIYIPQGKIHQLRGGKIWGGFFEVWEHIGEQRSNEDDIRRLWDKYGKA